jgi:hypothetical protein
MQCAGETRKAHTDSVKKLNRKDHWYTLGIHTKNNIKMYLTDVGMRTWVRLIWITTETSGGLL